MSVTFLISTQEFGGVLMMPISEISVISQKGFILEKVTNKQKKRKLMSGSKEILFMVYIIT